MSARRSGSLAGATIAVWKAWLTGSGTTCRPAAVRISMARRTAAVAPPTTAWLELFTLATTAPGPAAATARSTSSTGAKTAAISPRSSTVRWLIPAPRALTASSVCSNVRQPAAIRAPYSPRLWPMTRSGRMP